MGNKGHRNKGLIQKAVRHLEMGVLMAILFVPLTTFGQRSIEKGDIEIHTQLTLLTVASDDVPEFEKNMSGLSGLSRKIQIGEEYDWLLYKSDSGEYLLVNFSDGIEDILTLDHYRKKFHEHKAGAEFDRAIESIKQLDISLDRNYIKQMLLPWSTVEEISVSEFPLATMIEYRIQTDKIDEFDAEMRKFAKLLKETDYPYPLEGNRGSVGAYGVATWVWFYDDRTDYEGKNNLLDWMSRHNRMEELMAVLNKIGELAKSKKVYHLRYKKELSY